MRLENKKRFHIYILNLLVTTVIFLALYHNFVFGEAMYAYSDIGSDTINQYLPMSVYEINAIRQGNTGTYDLQLGLGAYNSSLIKYLNPGNLPVLLFGEEYLHVGILLSAYVKYALIGIVSLCFFLHLLRNEKAAFISALLWTFNGFNVLWGQHYQFLTTIAAFTLAVLGFQLFLEDDRKLIWTVACMAFFALTSYSFLYMSCWFFLVYGVLYLKFTGSSFREILKKAGRFALALIPAVFMGATYLIPSVESFFASSRVGQVFSASAPKALVYEIGYLLSFAARFLSSNLIGTGNLFRGPVNYYECAILSVSLLVLFSLCYLLQGKNWKRVLGITLGCGLLLITPLTSKLLVFTEDNQRWTFMLCFAQTIAVGFALADISKKREEQSCHRALVRALVGMDVLLGLLAGVLVLYDWHCGGNWLSRNACLILVITAVIYHAVFLAFFKIRRIWPVLLAAVVLEMVLCNYATVNSRGVITKEQWYSDMYNDGTEAVVQWIQEQDPGIYRISKTYHSAYYTDSLIQDYNGMGIYSSTNSAELLNLAHSYGYSYARNWLGFDGTDLLANSMLGVKYIITENGTYMDPEYYSSIYHDETYTVYRNEYYLGFGYLYGQELPSVMMPDGTTLEKTLALSSGYFLTENAEKASADSEEVQRIDLLPYLTELYQCEGTQVGSSLELTGTAADMLLYFTVPELEEDWLVSGVRVTMHTEKSSNIKLFTATDTYDFCVEHYDYVTYDPGTATIWLDNTVLENVRGLRLDISTVAQTVTIESVELITVNAGQIRENLSGLQQTAVADLKQDENRFSCNAENSTEADAMLCIPLIYSRNWKAKVDGKAAQVQNINGGLIGITVSPGSHLVELEYDAWADELGCWISILSVAVFAAYAVWTVFRRRKSAA